MHRSMNFATLCQIRWRQVLRNMHVQACDLSARATRVVFNRLKSQPDESGKDGFAAVVSKERRSHLVYSQVVQQTDKTTISASFALSSKVQQILPRMTDSSPNLSTGPKAAMVRQASSELRIQGVATRRLSSLRATRCRAGASSGSSRCWD